MKRISLGVDNRLIFFDFLKSRNRWQQESDFFTRLSEPTFQAIWDNEDDAVYDKFLQEV